MTMLTLMPGRETAAAAVPGSTFSLAVLQQTAPRYTQLGILLLLAMVPVAGAAILDDRLFQGVNVWLKPLKFLFALSVFLLTLAWFARFADPAVTRRRWWAWHERAVVLAVIAEMIWIGGAAAFGTASHFNTTSPIMSFIYPFMGAAAILLTSATSTLAYAIYRNKDLDIAPVIKSGLVWGLALTLPLTMITAGTMSSMNSHWVGGVASDANGLMIMGWARDGGDLRIAHFFATHAMHFIPLVGLVSAFLVGREARWPVLAASLLFTGFVVFVFVQALMGQPFLPGLGTAG